jgi:hypothetical protein
VKPPRSVRKAVRAAVRTVRKTDTSKVIAISNHSYDIGTVMERAFIVAALRRWAEEGGDPWMSACASRIEEGEHMHEPEEAP